MTNRARFALALVCACAMASSASAVTMFDLLSPGTTITSGDKVFSNFSWTSSAAGAGTAIDPADVTVSPFSQVVFGGLEYGLEFRTPTASLSGQGGLSATMTYTVTPNIPGRLISDNTLTMSSTVAASLGGDLLLLESAAESGTGLPLATKLTVDEGIVIPNVLPILFVHEEYPIPVASADVHTQISLGWAGGGTGPGPQLHSFAQTFSQIPEPATMGLALMCGLFGAAVFLRRRWG